MCSIAQQTGIASIFLVAAGGPRYVLQFLEGIERVTGKNQETDSENIFVNKSSGRKLGPLAGGLVFMADDFDETPNCFKEYMIFALLHIIGIRK